MSYSSYSLSSGVSLDPNIPTLPSCNHMHSCGQHEITYIKDSGAGGLAYLSGMSTELVSTGVVTVSRPSAPCGPASDWSRGGQREKFPHVREKLVLIHFLGWTSDAINLGDATPNITLPSDITEESLIAAADRAIAEASTFPDEATQRVVMEESNSSSDEAISLSTSWDFRRNPSTRRQSSEDLSQFYRRLNQSTPPTVSPISSGSFHSGFSPDPSSQESLISMEVAVGSPPLLSPSADRDPQWEAMRAVSRSLSIVTQVHHIGEGAVYEANGGWCGDPRRRSSVPPSAAWEEIRERWMVRRPEEEFRAAAPAAWEEIRSILADFLYETATRMEEDSRRRNTAAPSNGSTPATQPREVSCPVCFANLPTIALRLCGHTLCRPCSNRVGDRCPTCRELIVGRFTIYLPR
ncbi:hypothetical protein J6590_019527 [Homalodisca vitripennis]|nr:hypothetical protein J6590_019527 [Homalodisca vitripennis]